MQLDKDYKGFSFSKEGPLDMRMNPSSHLTAREIVNTWTEEEIGRILRDGEERNWRRAAKAIVEARKKKAIETTTQLAEIIVDCFRSRSKLHPATLIFQALRICVNKELEAIQTALAKAIQFVCKDGRIGAMSFHSLEDRIVKNMFKSAASPEGYNKKKGIGPLPVLSILTKKPLVATLAEIRANPRARSAKLRFAEKI